jgi:hypothetical protein
MKIKKVITLTALITGLSITAQAHAELITATIDEFNELQKPGLLHMYTNVGAASVSASNTKRTLTQELLASDGEGISITKVTKNTNTGNNILYISNTPAEETQVTVSWNLAPGLIASSYANYSRYYFDVESLVTFPLNVSFSFKETAAAIFTNLAQYTFTTPVIKQAVSFAMDVSQVNKINQGGNLKLVINGGAGWGLSLDAFKFSYLVPPPILSVPELNLMGLTSLSLAGLGLFRRRVLLSKN